jgi:hypothetical protein
MMGRAHARLSAGAKIRAAAGAGAATAMALAAMAPDAAAASAYCSPSGDVCYSAGRHGGAIYLRLRIAAGYFTRYRLCIEDPDGDEVCRRFRMRRVRYGYYSRVRWSAHFPRRGPGVYRVGWDWGYGRGERLSFRIRG